LQSIDFFAERQCLSRALRFDNSDFAPLQRAQIYRELCEVFVERNADFADEHSFGFAEIRAEQDVCHASNVTAFRAENKPRPKGPLCESGSSTFSLVAWRLHRMRRGHASGLRRAAKWTKAASSPET
jgi:hypothetical protein